MRSAVTLSLALACVALSAAACGGGSSGTAASETIPIARPTGNTTSQVVTMTVAIPRPPANSASRRGFYVSSGTQSLGVVVTNQGATPSAPQYTNVSTCPQVSGVTTCTLSVQALPGSDSFAITAYSGQSGGGSVLSSGSITSAIVAGVANTTMPVTMGGVIASIAMAPAAPTLPLGQATLLNLQAKDASGATIVGTFDNPISLSASNVALSKTSVTNSNDASQITAAWNYGFAGTSTSTVTATGDGVTGTTTLTPGSGIEYFQTGTEANYDTVGFKIIAGSDGNLYYTSLGPVSCVTGQTLCTAGGGAIHRFNPTTDTDTEVDVQTEVVGLSFSSDGALWIGGGTHDNSGTYYLYRMAPGTFSSANLTPIPVPTTSAMHRTINIREAVQDGSGNMWFVDTGGGRYMKIPVAGPYTSSSITYYSMPAGPAGTPQYPGGARTLHYINGVITLDDFENGIVDVVNPSTGSVTGQYLSNLQASLGANAAYDSANPYDATDNGSVEYVGNLGDWNLNEPNGDLEEFNPSTNAFTTMPFVNGPSGQQATVPSVSGSLIYVADYYKSSLDVVNTSASSARSYPLIQSGLQPVFQDPSAVVALSDGTAWFPCYGSAQVFQPLCIGHTVYLSNWTVWPGTAVAINGTGPQSAQLMGIMEAPSANSGPFTVTSSNTSVCTVVDASDHNFVINGVAAGSCIVSVKDKNGVTQSVNATVTTTSGTVQAKKLGGVL